MSDPEVEDALFNLEQAVFNGAIAAEQTKRDALQAKLDQIAAVCRDNAAPTCNHAMALDFVRQVAERDT